MNFRDPLQATPADAQAQVFGPTRLRLQTSHTETLGANIADGQIHFALAAPHARGVELCLFDALGQREMARLALPAPSAGIWRGALPLGDGIGPGLVYGWRVQGPWAPHAGHRFNPAKLLLDPCAREVVGRYDGHDIHLGHRPDAPEQPDPRDNAATALKARVVSDLPALSVPRPRINPASRVIYELHVKGFTALHPDVPVELRGSYAGLAHPAAVQHLQRLGITTVCLMPVAHRADEARLQAQGLSNYWGYSPIAWSAPEARYACSDQVRAEFRGLVDALHAAGIEVVLDVVYNHTAETDEFGPTLSLRGIDNALYYHLLPQDCSRYANWTGCGNSVNLNQPLVLRTVMDSLRRWVGEYGIDGFRFDLAPVLARGEAALQGSFQHHAPLLGAIAQDPLLRDRLMIAEPWDIGPGGYQLGAFPNGWLEWNDRFRDTLRASWLHQQGTRGALATRLAGSSDVFGPARRPAHSSVNFITAHDGFTLRDLVSYEQRHNLANGEDNRDGHADNLSCNHGVEGDTDNAAVTLLRGQRRRALLASLLLSLGTPMLLAGDELGHSQHGNNNAYCQDNATTWIDWTQADLDLCAFVQRLIQLRHDLPLLQASQWWSATASGTQARWLAPDGSELSDAEWSQPGFLAFALQLHDHATGQAALLLVNASGQSINFSVPTGNWVALLDSAAIEPPEPNTALAAAIERPAASLWLATAQPAGTPKLPMTEPGPA